MKTVDYEHIVRDVGALAQLLGVPAAALATEVAALAVRLGCSVIGCDDSPEAPRAPLPDLASRYDDAMADIDREAAGITRSGR